MNTKHSLGSRILALLCALALMFSVMPAEAFAEASVPAGGVTVSVTDDDSQPVNGATVNYTYNDTSASETTDINGQATITLSEGDILKTIEVSAAGYQSVSQNYDGGNTVNVQLTAVKIDITGITDSETSFTLDMSGLDTEKTLNPTIAPSNYTEEVIWESNDTDVATVTNGVVTAIADGTATITVRAKDHPEVSLEYSVIVEHSVTSVSLNKSTLGMNPGNVETLIAEVEPTNATNKTVTWESDNSTVATVDSTGKVTAHANGVAVITVKSNNNLTASCNVSVTTPAATVTIKEDSKPVEGKIVYGSTHQFAAETNPDTSTDTIVWSVEGDAVEIDQNGMVSAKKFGTAKIKVTAGTASDEYDITVEQKEIKVTSITLNHKEYDGTTNVDSSLLSGVAFDAVETGDSVTLSGISFGDTSSADAGTTEDVTVDYTGAVLDNSNYILAGTDNKNTANVTIDKKALTVAALTDSDDAAPEYTAAASYAGLKLTVDGIVAADSDLSSDIDDIVASSTGKINVATDGKDVSLDYSNADVTAYTTNYILPTTAKLVVGAKSLTAKVTGYEKEYDGTTNVVNDTQFGAELNGVINGDTVTPSVSNSTYADKNAADSVSVSADVILTGTDAANYTLDASDITFVPAKISKSNHNVVMTVVVAPDPANPDVDLTVTITAHGTADGRVALDGEATVLFNTRFGTNSKNVEITNGEGTCKIKAVPGEQVVTVSFVIADTVANYTGTHMQTAIYNEGYMAQELNADNVIQEVTYGVPAALGIYAVEAGNNTATNAVINYTSGNEAAATIGTDGTITVVDYEAAKNDGYKVIFTAYANEVTGYYNASYPVQYEVALKQKEVTPRIICAGKIYDGTNVATVVSGMTGIVSGDTGVVLSNNGIDGNLTAVYDDANVHEDTITLEALSDHTVTAQNLSLIGKCKNNIAADHNYKLVTNTVTASNVLISKRDISDGEYTLAYDDVTESTMYYTGANREPVPTLKVDLDGDGTKETTLTLGNDNDYTVAYTNQKELSASGARAKITGVHNYTGEQIRNYSIIYKPVDPAAAMVMVKGEKGDSDVYEHAYPKDAAGNVWWYNSDVVLTPATGYTIDDMKPTSDVVLQSSKTYGNEGLNILNTTKLYLKETKTGFISEMEIGDILNIDKTAPKLTAMNTTIGVTYDEGDYYKDTFTTTFTVEEANYNAETGNSAFSSVAGTDVTVYGDDTAKATVTTSVTDNSAITVTVAPGIDKNTGEVNEIAGEYHIPYVTITDPAGNKLEVDSTVVNALCVDGKVSDKVIKCLDTKSPEVVITYTDLDETHYYEKNAYYKGEFTATFVYSDENGIDLNKVYKAVDVSEGSEFAAVNENPDATNTVITVGIGNEHKNDGHYQFGAYGTDKAGNALKVSEMQTALEGTDVTTDPVVTEDVSVKTVSEYHKVLDTTNPVATLVLDKNSALRKELQTNYNNRFYLNDSFTATITIQDTNYDTEKVTVREGIVNANTVRENGKTFQTQEVTASKKLTAIETRGSYEYTKTADVEGVYIFDFKGVDRAGNMILLDGEMLENNIQTYESDTSAISAESTDRYISYVIAEDKTHPVLNITMKDGNNRGNKYNEATGNFYEAALSRVTNADGESEDSYQISTNWPYRSSKTADFGFTTDDQAPVTVEYAVESTAPSSNFDYKLNGAMIGVEGVAPTDSYVDGLAYTRTVVENEQIIQINKLIAEDLAGNKVSYSKSENENKIYLDVKTPTDDNLNPVVKLTYPKYVTKNTMSRRPIEGVDLYKNTVVVTADVLDPYTEDIDSPRGSGLYRVYYKVLVNGAVQTDKVGLVTASGMEHKADADGVYYVDYKTSGQVGQVDSNETLTASDKLTFTFDPNANGGVFNYNSIELIVWAVDNANNEINEANRAVYKFGIDVTAPTIKVNYDNNDAQNEKYFKEDRIATVTVTERNFDASRIHISTESSQISEWAYAAGAAANGDQDTWTCTITYNTDGVYTLSISGEDQLGISASAITYNGAAPQDFVIDKTPPTVDISFDNNDVRNGKYYNMSRTATLSVTDVNFDGQNDISVSATVGGVAPAVNFSGLTAVLPFEKDGTYDFSGTVTDMAGNVSETFDVDEFVIDQTAPELSIEGVENMTAYAEEVLPRIVFSDQNYEENTIELLRTVLNEKNVNVSELIVPMNHVSTGADGLGNGVVSYEDLEYIAENDGIYTLNATVTDLAGNSTDDTVTYSVNRFGSVYVYSDALSGMLGEYRKKADNELYITAYNVTPLVEDSAKLLITCDGSMLENQSSIAKVGSDARIGTSGWYEYQFDIDNSDLINDGRYEIYISDMDTAGNTKTNAENPVWFYIDATKPTLDSIVGLEESIVNADNQLVSFKASDAIALEEIAVYVDGAEVLKTNEFTSSVFEDEFTIGTGLYQTVRIVVKDKAGNTLDTDDGTFAPSYKFNNVVTVSTNFFVRWYANKPLFYGSIAGMICIAGGITYLTLAKRRKKAEAHEE